MVATSDLQAKPPVAGGGLGVDGKPPGDCGFRVYYTTCDYRLSSFSEAGLYYYPGDVAGGGAWKPA